MKFSDFLEKVTSGSPLVMMVAGGGRKVVFSASYYTEHYPNDEYIKVFFDDRTVLQVVPKDETLYFCDDERREISRSLVEGSGKLLEIDGKRYFLDNGDDKQFVKKVYYGDIRDGEGECIFSDYSSESGDEVWSLAVLDDGTISDIHVRKIDLAEIGFYY